jgi:hypothetical protein
MDFLTSAACEVGATRVVQSAEYSGVEVAATMERWRIQENEMLKLLRFVESPETADRVMTWCCYVGCGSCTVAMVVMWIVIFLEHR